jgi:hypothetical protein
MIVPYTKIIKTESDENSVTITFRPKGSDTADRPMTIQLSPHDDYVFINICGLQEKRITHTELGANIARIYYGREQLPVD